jgi:hypothetical protein
MRRSIVSVMFWDGLRATLRLPMAYEMLEWIDARGSNVGVLPEIELAVELRMRPCAFGRAVQQVMPEQIARAVRCHVGPHLFLIGVIEQAGGANEPRRFAEPGLAF